VIYSDQKKHHRRSIRRRDWDYRAAATYFVTLVNDKRVCLFGDVENNQIRLNKYGQVIETEWLRTAEIRPNIELDEIVIMPNHFHAILIIHDDDHIQMGVRVTATDLTGPPSGSLGAIMAQFKSIYTKRINVSRKTSCIRVWQRNYYERIIRNERELDATRQYILNNPVNWSDDPDSPTNVRMKISD